MADLFKLEAPFSPAGDQPAAIEALCAGIKSGRKNSVLLGVTGSGKTYTMACVMARLGMPALVISPNKVLAAQLYSEFRQFFPENAVEYFISYYDYYQPEAYIPQTDTYIEKDAAINEHIDKLRLKTTTSLLTRRDVIVVASVSCIYNIGSPESFAEMCVPLKKGAPLARSELTAALAQIRYERNEAEFTEGKFRARGGAVDIFPPYSQSALRVEFSGGVVSAIRGLNPLTGDTLAEISEAWVYPAKHFVSPKSEQQRALAAIRAELALRLDELKAGGKLLEAQRLEQRTRYDLEMLEQAGYCSGVENYSRHLDDRPSGSRPMTLIDYFIKGKAAEGPGFLVFIDESHVAVPQIRGMYEGDRSRKRTLIDFGFRLPSALDNRPLKFAEFESLLPPTVYVSATPGPYEMMRTCGVEAKTAASVYACAGKEGIAEQIIRPTGLIDPPISIQPTQGQIAHLSGKIQERASKGERTLVLALTKKTAEDLSAFLVTKGVRARYIHSDLETLERIDILNSLRKGEFDALVGINLLREGLDVPEVSLVAILEADNEGLLRSETTLIQIAGRAARHACGEVILYADRVTGSMERALKEMERRRARQLAYNKEHGITPKTIIKAARELEEFRLEARLAGLGVLHTVEKETLTPETLPKLAASIEAQMKQAADNLDFELAAALRDRLLELRDMAVKNGIRLAARKKTAKRKT
ncbi:MAG: excinuclease ABC subunit UvrB [Elusimicrobiales bacterium]|nr:excinuclease ABC subunit UvrB [Elusimicrobiales bacterium]